MVELDWRRRRLEASVAPSGAVDPFLFNVAGMISESCSHRLSRVTCGALGTPRRSRGVLWPCSPFVESLTAMLMPEFEWVSHAGTPIVSSVVPRIFCALVVKGPEGLGIGGGGACFGLRPGRGKTNLEEWPIAGVV